MNTTTTRTITVTFDLDTEATAEATAEDVRRAVEARLDEIYPTDASPDLPRKVAVSVMNRDAVDKFLAAAEVGLEGTDEDDLDAAHAWQILDDLRGR